MAANRLDRINAEMERVLQNIISNELKDPRVTGMVSVTRCAITNDFKHAKVLVSIYADSEEQKKQTFDAIGKCSGFLRRRLAEGIDLRCVPELHFELDTSLDNSMRINEILAGLHKEEK